jgi:GNAT superfamily N-acetyltransferase
MIGLFADAGDDHELVAAAAYDVWDDLLAHLAVVASPERRNQGYGRAVVSRATERALAEGLIPQYRTADAWPWSVALAEGLGFCQFGTSVLVSIGESP